MLMTCPSGLKFKARKWLIGDRRNLRDNKVVKQGLLLRRMLEVVDEGVEDPGPYPFEAGKKAKWGKVAIPDIIDALIEIRISTKSELDYNDACEQCGAKIPLTIDLKGLTRLPMSSEGTDHLSSGAPLETDLPCEDGTARVKIRLLLGEDMPKLTKYYRQDPALLEEAQAVLHLVEVTPPGATEPLTQINAIWDFYRKQGWEFQDGLTDFLSKVSGGVETRVDSECRRCNAEQTSVIPFGVEFFYPQKTSSISSMGML
jgi:hypothetical protein